VAGNCVCSGLENIRYCIVFFCRMSLKLGYFAVVNMFTQYTKVLISVTVISEKYSSSQNRLLIEGHIRTLFFLGTSGRI
jgi:hypothetical protein